MFSRLVVKKWQMDIFSAKQPKQKLPLKKLAKNSE